MPVGANHGTPEIKSVLPPTPREAELEVSTDIGRAAFICRDYHEVLRMSSISLGSQCRSTTV